MKPVTPPPPTDAMPTVSLMGLRLASVDWRGLLDHIFASLKTGRGGWVITANLDFLRRYVRDPEARDLYDAAGIRVADGMPLVWACQIQGDKLPERVPGSSLVWSLVERAAREGRSLYLLGGAPGVNERAARVLYEKYPGLKLCGGSSPLMSSPPSPTEVGAILPELLKAQPDILLVGLGSPKQEQLIRLLRDHLPSTWMVGIGVSFSFISGDLNRAPEWMGKLGGEWIHRMVQDPRRLGKRYLVDDLPFAVRMFFNSFVVRMKRRARKHEQGTAQ